ncbi:MAG: CapA family protein, partial [Balneolaceae bacterium]|nr:CapA family protein [Balneolaceae bacterium]
MESPKTADLTLLLAGDVMTGRGIDQVLPHSSEPRLHETYASSARQYVRIAERENGPIPDRLAFDYVWGDALKKIESIGPDVRIINLETAVTTSDDWWRGKRIHYRMHPGNAEILTVASIDICVLANNHIADWGFDGLRETVRVLQQTGLKTAGAGNDRNSAKKPAILDHGSGRLLVFSYATPDAGVPLQWSAGPHRPG